MKNTTPSKQTISPYDEALAFEYLYTLHGMSLKKLSDATSKSSKLPSEVLDDYFGLLTPDSYFKLDKFLSKKISTSKCSIAVKDTPSWPNGILDSSKQSPVIYFQGDISLLQTPRVSVVGSRKASEEGKQRATKIGHELAAAGVTVVSGLASGIDSSAMRGALNTPNKTGQGKVIGVIGTPIDEFYPKENRELQKFVSNYNLLISQVPFYRYSQQAFSSKRYYFPERNELMSAISQATIIIEASDTSGSLTQARACSHQKRPLFILRSCINNHNISWPAKWASREGVYILDDVNQVLDIIQK